MRWLFSLYPPFVGAGIHVTHIASDWRQMRVEMPLRFYNRNYVGTHFGGSLYVMTDPLRDPPVFRLNPWIRRG